MSVTPAIPPAGAITVAQTLDLLDGAFAPLAQALSDGRYVLWLGSAISRDRAPGLADLIMKVLAFLQERIDPSDANCPHLAALQEVITVIIPLSADERATIDLSQPPANWPAIDRVVAGLTDKYADLLDVRVLGHDPDYLIWEAIDVRETYGVDLPPDCEHLCVAILAAEGAVREVASANWDGMLEAAFAEILGELHPLVRVVVLADELRGAPAPIVLLKFHGCAVRARTDPTTWRETVIGRRSQIQRWMTGQATKPVYDELISLASTRPTLMIGMSAQDQNIQQLFNEAQAQINWPWPAVAPDPPAYVFAEDRLGAHQKAILRVVYGTDYDAQPQTVEAEALLPAYAKALLTALVLATLRAKLIAFLEAIDAPGLDAGARSGLAGGIVTLVAVLAAHAEPDRLAFLRRVLEHERRAMALFRTGAETAASTPAYLRLSAEPVHLVSTGPDLATNGVRELAGALALLGRGVIDGRWTIEAAPTSTSEAGAVTVRKGTEETAVFFAANGAAEVELWRSGLIDDTRPETVLIQSTAPSTPAHRSPGGVYGRTGAATPRRVEMAKLLRSVSNVDDLERQFRLEAVL